MSEEKIFVEGIFADRKDNAPDFVLCNLSFKCREFLEFMKQHANEKGYINVDVKRSKNGKVYAELNTWKPDAEKKAPAKDDFDDDIPF